jgi:hypothetical protein
MRSTAIHASWESEPEGALLPSRSPQFSGVKSVTDRCLTEVMRRRPQSSSLIHSALIDQSLDFTLQPCNSTLATLSPVLKGLRVLEEVWQMTEFDHLHTTQGAFRREAVSQNIRSEPRLPRLLSRDWECSGRSDLAKLFTWGKKSGNVAATGWPSISAAVSPCRGSNYFRPS